MAHAAAAGATATSRVMVVVQEQQSMVQQGRDILLKVRLSPGVSAKIWVDVVCGSPNEDAILITQSGSYVLPIASIQGRGNLYSCMLSSDGRLKGTVPIQ